MWSVLLCFFFFFFEFFIMKRAAQFSVRRRLLDRGSRQARRERTAVVDT